MAIQTKEILVSDENGSRKLVGEELESFLAQKELDNLEIAKSVSQAKDRQIQRQAILDRLGLTADEAKLLLG